MKLTIIIQQDEDGRFNVTCPELKGCNSYGNTHEDAVRNIREAIELYLEDMSESELKKLLSKVRIEKIAV
jgi:predicted RNase H-like HicB family nuclease